MTVAVAVAVAPELDPIHGVTPQVMVDSVLVRLLTFSQCHNNIRPTSSPELTRPSLIGHINSVHVQLIIMAYHLSVCTYYSGETVAVAAC